MTTQTTQQQSLLLEYDKLKTHIVLFEGRWPATSENYITLEKLFDMFEARQEAKRLIRNQD